MLRCLNSTQSPLAVQISGFSFSAICNITEKAEGSWQGACTSETISAVRIVARDDVSTYNAVPVHVNGGVSCRLELPHIAARLACPSQCACTCAAQCCPYP